MNIGDVLYCKVPSATAYSVESLINRANPSKVVVSSLNIDTLNDSYGFDDAQEDFIILVNRPKKVGRLKSIVVVNGESFGIVDLPCVHYDDGHDGFLGIASSPSIDRNFTINLGFDLNDLTSTKPADFQEKTDETTTNGSPNKKVVKPPVTGANGKDTAEKKNNNILYGGIGATILLFCIWFFGFRKS